MDIMSFGNNMSNKTAITILLTALTLQAYGFLSQAVPQRPRVLFSILDDINKSEKDNNKALPDNFNPFDFKKSRNTHSNLGYSGTQISMRKISMQQLVDELLNVVGRPEETQEILENYKSFLLEPLDDDEAVLDPDSIYDSTMDREARYEAYRKSLDDRIKSARNKAVRAVLQSMQEFVLQQK